MERTRATSTNTLELKIVQLKVPEDSSPRFWGQTNLLADLTSITINVEEHRKPVKPIDQRIIIDYNKRSSLDQLYIVILSGLLTRTKYFYVILTIFYCLDCIGKCQPCKVFNRVNIKKLQNII